MILLIWQELPEITKFFLIPEESADTVLFTKCHNKMLGEVGFSNDDNAALNELCELLQSEYSKFEVPVGTPVKADIKEVYFSGIIL